MDNRVGFRISNYEISMGMHREKQVIFFKFANIDILKNELRSALPRKMVSN